MPSLAEKIDKLFKSIAPGGREYTYEEVARGCSELSGGTFSKTYIWQLRTGQRDNPTKRHLEALAAFFHVPVAYFFDEDTAERIDTQIALASAMRNAEVRDIALRAMSMDDAGRASLLRIIAEVSGLQSSGTGGDGQQETGRREGGRGQGGGPGKRKD
ncbi:XRE family transcriptional regulator [Streptomyces marispadix]|uniref:XRE family transcriptional regulator n=1 Tax=Streptomyces marispadix TaxID=2922868 RepID=A0ABS9SV42_9ACTN|nr:XRE family transcriptional regulator [Streptomyces marispadix]MCH6159921.1 XRE family transcriptional regulator [Streptomyces marispadix]